MYSFWNNAEHMASIQKVLAIVTTAVLFLIFICHNENGTEIYPNIPLFKCLRLNRRNKPRIHKIFKE